MVACERSPDGLPCPRCDSTDTKFCYYNNYNASQPRHFCKTCKRYWTAGGTLRNVPVGGGLRKNKKSKLLNHVKDMISSSSSSPDEFLHGALSHPGISHDAFTYEVTRALVFAPPLFINSSSLSTDTSINGNPTLQAAFRNPGPLDYGYFAESRIDGSSHSHSMDPSLLPSLDATRPLDYHGGNKLTLPVNFHHRVDVGLEHIDQAQPYGGDVSEVPTELSQASSEALKDHQHEHITVINQCQSGNVEQSGEGGVGGHLSSCERDAGEKEEMPLHEGRSQPYSKERMILPATQFREKPSTQDEDDELGNVVNVRYPFDWEQVSEVVFERMPDFFQLSGY